MRILQSIFCVMFFALAGCSCNYTQDLKQADQTYEAGDRDAAKELYLKAAKKGSPEAHFAIAYKYNVTPEESIYHFSEAAKRGHDEALDYALDALLFRANSLERANPQKALEIYKQAKKANPKIRLYDEDVKLKTIQMSVEPGPFDWKAFCKKYNVTPHDDEAMYHVWVIAEEASRGGRFGKPDPKLILQLVSRGGWAPAELEYAVVAVHKNWKSGTTKEFNICDYITSGGGMAFCASRADDQDGKDRNKRLSDIRQKLNANSRKLLDAAYSSAIKFIETKAFNEEGHGGSGRGAWVIGSQMEQKNAYLDLIEKVRSGYKPSPKSSFVEADRKLNETYKKVMAKLKKKADDYNMPRVDDVRAVQRLWIPYRDANVKLFMAINPAIGEDVWKSWVTEIREKQLKKILSF
ncbi:MAG: lysozyme inhibitor LprI family protein [Candidatus Omnitrophica bacterium]|nr:lysozyme inhibitor LprI family protein [Candidatus Omnitrophota bacterium]